MQLYRQLATRCRRMTWWLSWWRLMGSRCTNSLVKSANHSFCSRMPVLGACSHLIRAWMLMKMARYFLRSLLWTTRSMSKTTWHLRLTLVQHRLVWVKLGNRIIFTHAWAWSQARSPRSLNLSTWAGAGTSRDSSLATKRKSWITCKSKP